MGSSALEHAIKARKPYTISKQRERWSEEEHNKFIEALKLHGRAWREIEDLVGTKTAVQIRSHAQKFFTKVIRESTSVNSSQVKSMEIPPPRPKKKPMHPYPRKLGNIPNSHLMKRPEWSLVPQLSAPGQEDNLSPTSIVSIVGSDTFGSSTSPVSSVVGSDPAETLTSEQENGSNSTTTTSEHRSDMDLEFATNDNVPCKEPSAMEAPATSLRLFGKTMLVADPQKPLCSTFEEAVQCYNPFSAIDFERQHQQNATDWNSWQKRATQMFYLLPYYSNTSNFEAGVVPMPSPLFSVQKEDSFTESNALSSVEASIGNNGTHKASVEDCDDHDAVPSFKLRQSERSAFRSLKSISEKPTKGFMPYKRCVSDREVDNQKMVSKNGEGQAVQLCL